MRLHVMLRITFRAEMFEQTHKPTEGNERSDDRHGQGSDEQVDGARQEGDLPHAGVSQPDDVGVSVVHLDVALNAGSR